MSIDQSTQIFICSYCEQAIKFRSDQEGRRVQCPQCKKPVWVFDNREKPIEQKLTSTWMYERPKLLGLLGSQMLGPVSDTEFLELIAQGEIERDFAVQSPQLTNSQEVQAGRVNLSIVRDMCNQRTAELQRLRNSRVRENERDKKNRETLLQGIRKAISDGQLTLNERTQLNVFASKVGISEAEVDDLLNRESRSLLEQAIEESLVDGFIDDQETEQISKIAIGLGLTLVLTKDQQFRISLARTAWNLLQQLRNGSLEQTLQFSDVEVFEIVALKRPVGIALGGDHYLKLIGSGTIKRADKNLLLDGRLTAKKYALSSIVGVQWFSDGLFVKRSSGKSLFIRPIKMGLEWHKFAMSMEVLASAEPVVGTLPDESFIPSTDLVVAEVIDESAALEYAQTDEQQPDNWEPASRIPRFTFRVVGESFENRYRDLNRLILGENVYLARQPDNSYDSNAVAVINREGRTLGYLKREVSIWFAPILDRGRQFRCEVKQRLASGGIVIAVFE